jgi:hypothetical protein
MQDNRRIELSNYLYGTTVLVNWDVLCSFFNHYVVWIYKPLVGLPGFARDVFVSSVSLSLSLCRSVSLSLCLSVSAVSAVSAVSMSLCLSLPPLSLPAVSLSISLSTDKKFPAAQGAAHFLLDYYINRLLLSDLQIYSPCKKSHFWSTDLYSKW